MPQCRRKYIQNLINDFSHATLELNATQPTLSKLGTYVLKYGVFHLITQKRYQEAKKRLANLMFFSLFLDSHRSFVTPLQIWRVIGLQQLSSTCTDMIHAAKKTSSSEHLESLHTISSFLRAVGLLETSILFAEEILRRKKVRYGEKSTDYLLSIAHLGMLYGSQRKFHLAKPLYIQVLKGGEDVLGIAHPIMVITYNNLAVLYKKEGKYHLAEDLYNRVLLVEKTFFGEGNPKLITVMNNLASVYYAQNKYHKAIQIQEEVLKIINAQREDFPETIVIKTNLAKFYQKIGQTGVAEKLLLQAEIKAKYMLGHQHVDTLLCQLQLASLYQEQDKNQDAENTLQSVYGVSTKTLPEDHYINTRCESLLIETYVQSRRFTEANQITDTLVKKTINKYGISHPKTLSVWNNLGWSHIDNQSHHGLQYFEQCMNLWTDPEDWKSYWVRLGHALSLMLLREENQKQRVKTLHESLVHLLGESHPRVQKADTRIQKINSYVIANQ